MKTIQHYKDWYNFAMAEMEKYPDLAIEFKEEADNVVFEGAKEYNMLPREFKSRLMFTF